MDTTSPGNTIITGASSPTDTTYQPSMPGVSAAAVTHGCLTIAQGEKCLPGLLLRSATEAAYDSFSKWSRSLVRDEAPSPHQRQHKRKNCAPQRAPDTDDVPVVQRGASLPVSWDNDDTTDCCTEADIHVDINSNEDGSVDIDLARVLLTIPRKRRSGWPTDAVRATHVSAAPSLFKAVGHPDVAPTPTLHTHRSKGSPARTTSCCFFCEGCMLWFETLKAKQLCNACYQHSWRSKGRKASRQVATRQQSGQLPDRTVACSSLWQNHNDPPLFAQKSPTQTSCSGDSCSMAWRVGVHSTAAVSAAKQQSTDVQAAAQLQCLIDVCHELSSHRISSQSSLNNNTAADGATGKALPRRAGSSVNAHPSSPTDRVRNPAGTAGQQAWQSQPGCCQPCPPGVRLDGKPVRVPKMDILCAHGYVANGDVLTYRAPDGQSVLARGVIRDGGIECVRCGRVVGCTTFEINCAGSKLRKPCQNIYTKEGKTLTELLGILEGKKKGVGFCLK